MNAIRIFLTVIFGAMGFVFAIAQSYTEGPDLSNTAPGPSFTYSGNSTIVSGQMNTPGDGSEYFVMDLPAGCQLNSVNYSITDPYTISVSGYFQLGVNNQETYSGATSTSFANAGQFPTVPFPVSGPQNFQCQAQANVAYLSDWTMTFNGSCNAPCTPPNVPGLSAAPDSLCPGTNGSLNITGALNDATAWQVYAISCGGTFVDSTSGTSISISPSSTTTYFIRGEGGCVSPGSCAQVTVLVGDNAAPVLTCTSNQLLHLNGNCEFVLPDYANGVLMTDHCDSAPALSQSPPAGSTISASTQVTMTGLDASGNSGMCSFTVTPDDTIHPIDTSVTRSGNVLMANHTAASYQWLDCNNGHAPLPGENAAACSTCQNSSGSYAVELTVSGCKDTSACHAITINVQVAAPFGQQIRIFPNPGNGSFSIELGKRYAQLNVQIFDVLGNSIQVVEYSGESALKVSMEKPDGLYFIQISSEEQRRVFLWQQH